ncbi:glycosyltransferase [Flavobacteriaceae bacterium]|nr:glycosyltransferase [Flavobacteriaceae bacterium]
MLTISDISINIISYNREKYIVTTVKSILNQSIGEFEINIYDNGSSDGTVEKINNLNNKRINLFTSDLNIGFEKNFLRVITQSKKKFTIIFHDDDLVHHNYLEFILRALNENPNVSLICSGMFQSHFPERPFKNYNFSYINIKRRNLIGLAYKGFPLNFSSCMYKTENIRNAFKGKEIYGKISDRPIIFDSINDLDEVILFPGQFIHYRFHSGQSSNNLVDGPFPNQIFELHKLYYNELYLDSNFNNKLIFLTSFYYYMSLDYKNFIKIYNSRNAYILEFVKHVNGNNHFVNLSKLLFYLKIRYIFKIQRFINRIFFQYS